MSIFYVGVMALGYAPWCLACCAVHTINFVMALAIKRLCARDVAPDPIDTASAPAPQRATAMTVTSWEVVRALGLVFIIIVGLWQYRSQHLSMKKSFDALRPYESLVLSLRENPDFLLREFAAQPHETIPPRAQEATAGDRLRLVVFTDFECPPCYCNAKKIQKWRSGDLGSRLNVMIRHLPLCKSCNAGARTDRHPNACQAAYAAEAARIVGGEDAFLTRSPARSPSGSLTSSGTCSASR